MLKLGKRKGFTLVELLVVVAIIALLANLAVPHYRDAVDKARLSELVMAIDVMRSTTAERYQEGDRTMFPARGSNGRSATINLSSNLQLARRLGAGAELSHNGISFFVTANDDAVGSFPAGTTRSYLQLVGGSSDAKRVLRLLTEILPASIWGTKVNGIFLLIELVELRP